MPYLKSFFFSINPVSAGVSLERKAIYRLTGPSSLSEKKQSSFSQLSNGLPYCGDVCARASEHDGDTLCGA